MPDCPCEHQQAGHHEAIRTAEAVRMTGQDSGGRTSAVRRHGNSAGGKRRPSKTAQVSVHERATRGHPDGASAGVRITAGDSGG